ncbi:NAD(P)H-quinone oxidoreductase [Devosia rhodophyticola]|uniref:NAD(P)H-quinone oxidoreductase n=1 Tax=Devosia rhodophyticola TaxID=3026423 RepID=A0ABY7YVD9_9HYPH|nr:NAD(P)H-quinone oxidoreductase [Devosia rhodophyticola]WDR04899.1 NAD(P)H-quinone oxidoreductase [Devosia rhodophyticola]
MTAIAISTPGAPEVLQATTVAVPEIGQHEVLIQIAAAGLNGPDLAQRRGLYPPPAGASPLPGLEVSGHIAAVGESVSQFKAGDAVVALTNGGGYAEFVSVPSGQVLPLPQNWSVIDAAALPETWFTITQSLVMRAQLGADMSVLIHGAAGGIGGAAIQICTILGAKPIAVVSSTQKAAYAMSLGATATIDRIGEDIAERARALTNDTGVDRIVDIVGGATTAVNIAAAARFAHIVQISTLGGGKATVSLAALMAKQLTLSGSTLRPQSAQTKAQIAEHIKTHLWPALSHADWPRPKIEKFALNGAPSAHHALENQASYGKILLVTPYGNTLAQ